MMETKRITSTHMAIGLIDDTIREIEDNMTNLPKITPTHLAIQAIRDTIQELKLREAELIATLPLQKKRNHGGKQFLVNPVTGRKREF